MDLYALVQIRDGNNMTAPYLLSPTCGRYIFDYYYYDPSYPSYHASSQLYQSSGNAILLKFVTNDDVTGMGFNATWTAGIQTSVYVTGNEVRLLARKANSSSVALLLNLISS